MIFTQQRFKVLRAGGDFHVIDRQTGDLATLGTPSGGRLAEYAALVDADDAAAAWRWEQILNCFPLDAAAHLAERVSKSV
jgi:hypothetical protein